MERGLELVPLEEEEESAKETMDGAREEENQETTGSYKPREALVRGSNCRGSIHPAR